MENPIVTRRTRTDDSETQSPELLSQVVTVGTWQVATQ